MNLHLVYNDENNVRDHKQTCLTNPAKKQSGSRTPLSSLDANSSNSKTTKLKKKPLSLHITKDNEANNKQVEVSRDEHENTKESQNNRNEGERQSIKEGLESSSESVFRSSSEDAIDFWSDEMTSLLTLQLANPVYDSESDSDEEGEDENIEYHSSNTASLHDENRLESRLKCMTLRTDD